MMTMRMLVGLTRTRQSTFLPPVHLITEVDKLVAYVDRGMTFSEGDINNPGALKIVDVTGNPGNPATAPTSTQIQSAVGAGNPYVELATISVPIRCYGYLFGQY